MVKQAKVAIIGAGPAGLYTALRLLESKKYTLNEIVIFDANDYAGGRVRTLPLKQLPFTADIGAMRFINKRQLIITSLIKHLNLPVDSHHVPLYSHYLRAATILPEVADGQVIKKSRSFEDPENAPIEQDAFKLNNEERYFKPTELVLLAILKAFSNCHIEKKDIPDEYVNWLADANGKLQRIKDLNATNMPSLQRIKKIREFIKGEFGFDYFSFEEWQIIRNAAQYGGQNLYDVCLFQILQKELSPEAVILGTDSFGYNTIFAAANAADHIPWFLNEFSLKNYSAVVGGMSVLIESLISKIQSFSDKKNMQVSTWLKLSHSLQSIEKVAKTNKYRLKFLRRREGKEATELRTSFEKVFLCVSKGALERINLPSYLSLNKELLPYTDNKLFTEAIQRVKSYPLLKAFIFYRDSWFWSFLSNELRERAFDSAKRWGNMSFRDKNGRIIDLSSEADKALSLQNVDFVSMRIITDLPIRQIYLHGPGGIWKREDANTDLVKGMIMAYGDSRQAELWTSLAGKAGVESSHIQAEFRNQFKDGLAETIQHHGTSRPFVDMLRQNIEYVFRGVPYRSGIEAAQEPLAVFIQDWDKAPFYGGWHAWRIHCKPWEIRTAIQKPFTDEQIYICGEAFSADQGWIEGAFRTSEVLLQRYFQLDSPSWFDESNIRGTSLSSGKNAEKHDIIADYLNW